MLIKKLSGRESAFCDISDSSELVELYNDRKAYMIECPHILFEDGDATGEIYISWVYVSTNMRSQGIARQMLLDFISEIKLKSNVSVLSLVILEANSFLFDFYKSLGFVNGKNFNKEIDLILYV